MGRKCVSVCALLLLLVHFSQAFGSASNKSIDATSTETLSEQREELFDSAPGVIGISPATGTTSSEVSSPDAVLKQSGQAASDDRNRPSSVRPITSKDLVGSATPKSESLSADSLDTRDVYTVEGAPDREPVAIIGTQTRNRPLSESPARSVDEQVNHTERQQQQAQQETSALVPAISSDRRPSQENETKLIENVENASNENRNSSGIEAERHQTQEAIWAPRNLKTSSFSTHRKQEPSLAANTRAAPETGAVAIPVMHFGGQRFIEFGVVRTQKGPQILKNHILTQVLLPKESNDTRKITNLVRTSDSSVSPAQALVPLTPTIEDEGASSTENGSEGDGSRPKDSISASSLRDTSASTSQETSSSSSESSEIFSEVEGPGCRKDKPRRKRKVSKPKPVPASLASVFEFKRLSKKRPSSNSLLPKTLAEARATESSEDESFNGTPFTPGAESSYQLSERKMDAASDPKSRGSDDFLQNVLRNFGVQIEVVPVNNSTSNTTVEPSALKGEAIQTRVNSTSTPVPTVTLLPIIPPVQTLSRAPEKSDILHVPNDSFLKSEPPRVQIKLAEGELSVPAVKTNSKNRSSAKAAAVNSLGHEVSDGEKDFASSTKSSRQGFEVPTIPPVGSPPPSPAVSKPPTETFTIDLDKIRGNKRKTNRPKGGNVELTPGKVYIHDLESATFEEAPDEDGTLARNLEAQKKYEDDFVKNILQNYGVQLDPRNEKEQPKFISSNATPDSGAPRNVLPPPVPQQTTAAAPSPPLLTIRPPSPKEQLTNPPVFLHEPRNQLNAATVPTNPPELPSLRNVPSLSLPQAPDQNAAGGQVRFDDALRGTPRFIRLNDAIRVVPAPNLAGLQPQPLGAAQDYRYASAAALLAPRLEQAPPVQPVQQQPQTSTTTDAQQAPQFVQIQAASPQAPSLTVNQPTQSPSPAQDSAPQAPQATQGYEGLQQQGAPQLPRLETLQAPAPPTQVQSPPQPSGIVAPEGAPAQQDLREARSPLSVPSEQQFFHPHVRIVEKHQIHPQEQQQQQLLNNEIQLVQPQYSQTGDQGQFPLQQEPPQLQQQQVIQQQQQIIQQQQQLIQQQVIQQQQQQAIQQQQQVIQQEQPQLLQAGDRQQSQQQLVVQAGDQIQQQQQQVLHAGAQVPQQVIQTQQAADPGQTQGIGIQPAFAPPHQVQYLPLQQQPIDPQLQGQSAPPPPDQTSQPLQLLSPADIPADQQLRISQPQYVPLPSSDAAESNGLRQLDHAGAQQHFDQNIGTSSQEEQLAQREHHQDARRPEKQQSGVQEPLQHIPQHQEQDSLAEQQFQLVRDQQQFQLAREQQGDSREVQEQQEAELQNQRDSHLQQQQQQEIQLQQHQQQIQLPQQQEIELQQHQQQQQQQVQLPQQQISIQVPQVSIQNAPPQHLPQYQTSQLPLTRDHRIIQQPNLFRAAHNVATFPRSQAITVPTFEVENGQLRRVPAYTGRTRQLRLGPGFVTRGQFRPVTLKPGAAVGSTQTTALPFGGFQVTHFAPGTGATAQSTYRPDKNGLLSNIFSQSFNPLEGTSSTFRLNFGYRNRENSLLPSSFSNGKQFESLFDQIPSSQRIHGVELLGSQKKDVFPGNLFNNQRGFVLGSSGNLVSNVDLQSNGPNEYTGYIKKAARRKSR